MRRSKGVERDEESMRQVSASFLDSALDCLISSRLALAPDPRTWEAPTGALTSALRDDVEWSRSSEHIREVEGRLRRTAPQLGGHLDELLQEVHEQQMRSAAVGWNVGVQVATSRAYDA